MQNTQSVIENETIILLWKKKLSKRTNKFCSNTQEDTSRARAYLPISQQRSSHSRIDPLKTWFKLPRSPHSYWEIFCISSCLSCCNNISFLSSEISSEQPTCCCSDVEPFGLNTNSTKLYYNTEKSLSIQPVSTRDIRHNMSALRALCNEKLQRLPGCIISSYILR